MGFKGARRFIESAEDQGEIDAGKKSFKVKKDKKDNTVRVDIEILKGKAFKPNEK